MSASIIAQNLRKSYRLYDHPSDRLKELILKRPYHREFVALDDISFQLGRGDTLGIIGENGAGKSTLLKVLAKTLAPTSGSLHVEGRVSSLLELGSGFHPEFTGLENIYFYGALLGFTRAELAGKVEEILEFAEIGEFINYPLKTYSSGMYVRLAFAVATAVDPDILIIDEALSVGDLYFQKKSVNKILSFRERGKSIVFCSHAIYYINQLCSTVLWLRNGKAELFGNHYDVTQAYERYQLEKYQEMPAEQEAAPQGDEAPRAVMIRDVQTLPFPNLRSGDTLEIRIRTAAGDASTPYLVAALLKRVDGLDITSTYTKDGGMLRGDQTACVEFPSLQLRAGTYFVRAFVFDEHMLHIYDTKDSLPFHIPKDTIEVGLVDLPHRWFLGSGRTDV